MSSSVIGLRLYYVSNGQRVPEDLHLPNRPYLVHRAFKDLPETSPHRLAGVEPGLMMASAAANAASKSSLPEEASVLSFAAIRRLV
jgi:flagellar biosynthesis protein FlhF